MNEEISGKRERLIAQRLRQLLFLLIIVLTVEGVARKASPSVLSVPIFLLKDLIVSIMAVFVVQLRPPPAINFLWRSYQVLALLFVPLILVTAWHDPLLAIFGTKQYLLYPMVAFATFYGFHLVSSEEIFRFFRWIALLIIPTTILALIQLRLPHDHWLNMSVSGESVEIFAAGGELRISSTFSFVSQYCAFLNAQAFIIVMALHDWRRQTKLWKILLLSLVPLLIMACFATGSRGSVAGNTVILLLAAGLSMAKFQVRGFFQVVAGAGVLYLGVLAVNHFSPETTAAYSARQDGQLIGVNEEIWTRVTSSYFHFFNDPRLTTFLGQGLGIMSNGSDTFSEYAGGWRATTWTESDVASTFFEGGFYLGFLWYGFRLYVMAVTTRRFVSDVSGIYSVPGSFVQGFVIIIGAMGTLGIQPPVAIWFWFGVGTSLLLWWKCKGPSDSELTVEKESLPPSKQPRGRSLYAEALHKPDR